MNAPRSVPARILVPIDGDPFSDQALEPALEIARRSGAELRLIQVHVPYLTGLEVADLDPGVDQATWSAELGQLEQTAARLTSALGRPVTAELSRGDIATAIAQRAEAWHADLVVMTTHARKPAARFWLGSVAHRLVRTLTRPMLLIPPGAAPRPWRELRQILVPLDGSPFAASVLAEARRLGDIFGATFILYEAVMEPTPVVDPTGAVVLVLDEESLQQRVDEARIQLEQGAEEIRRSGGTATTVAAGANGAAAGILAGAASTQADLIAMATHARGGLRRFWFGSVTEEVLRRSPVPVLVLHPPG